MLPLHMLIVLLASNAPAQTTGPCVPLAHPIRSGLADALAGLTDDMALQFNMSFSAYNTSHRPLLGIPRH